MGTERKATMVSARLPAGLVARVDYVARNTDTEGVKNRSTALQAALESWLPGQENRLRELGLDGAKKAR